MTGITQSSGSKIEFKHANFVDGLYLIQTHKTATLYDKPVYVGCAILDVSKLRMLDFHYGTMEKHHKGKYDLLYSDTDSLVYHVKNKNLNKWFFDNQDEFDLSEMERKHRSEKTPTCSVNLNRRLALKSSQSLWLYRPSRIAINTACKK